MKYKNLKEHGIPLKSMQKWISALRSGKFKQGKGRLFAEDTSSYCCLGVCAKVLKRKVHRLDLPCTNHHPAWLASIDDKSANWVDAGLIFRASLAELNDEHDYTFDEIADILELMFIHDMPEYGKEK